MKRHAAVVALGMTLVAVPAYPCGGPGAAVVDRPLIPVRHFLSRTLYNEEFESELRAELRFLEPFRLTSADSIADLYAFAYEGGGYDPAAVDDTTRQRIDSEMLRDTRAAIRRGAYAEASASARRVVDRVLDLPAGVATRYRDVLRTAVEVADLAPRLRPVDREIAARYFEADSLERATLGSILPPVLREALAIRALPRDSANVYTLSHPTTPRLASLRFVAVQEAMRTGIPDGWAGTIADSVPPARWGELERLHDAWLREFSSHPMADYVRLSKVRLFYFKGDRERAWDQLLAIYPRRRQRVIGEMRYLVRQGTTPPSLDDPRIDWALRTALVTEALLTADQWNSYWRVTESRGGEGWARPMQERLLWQAIALAARNKSLPDAFPPSAATPTGLWGKLRLLALLEAGNLDAALVQADSVDAVAARDPASAIDVLDIAAIRTRVHLIRSEWGRAIETTRGDGTEAAQYLVRVLAPSPVVDSIAAGPRTPLTREALVAIAGRRARSGDWAAASRSAMRTGDAAFARRWARTASLAADETRSGRLEFARWMRDQHGALFFGENTDWLRGLNWRRNRVVDDTVSDAGVYWTLDPRLPWTAAEEQSKIGDHLRSTTELYYSLQAYARWLDGATATTPGLATVVREADAVYNRLVNWDNRNSQFWSEQLESSVEARAIRRAGRLVRRR